MQSLSGTLLPRDWKSTQVCADSTSQCRNLPTGLRRLGGDQVMENITSVQLRPHVGTRLMGKKLCLINQKTREIWLCGGISPRIWARLQKGQSVSQITEELSAKYRVPVERVGDDVDTFLEQLWQRRIVDLPHRDHITDEQRAAMLTEEAHNINSRLYREATEANTMFRVWLDL